MAIFSFGCRVNQAEMQNIGSQLTKLGYQYSENKPDFVIINTCAVTKKAEKEARQFIYQTRKKFPKAKIIATGCGVTKWLKDKKLAIRKPSNTQDKLALGTRKNIEKLLSEKKNIILIRNMDKDKIVSLISAKYKRQSAKQKHKSLSDKYLSSKRMLVKIQDGCNRFCTYCIVPYLRGKPASKSIKYLVSSIKKNEKKIKEVILTAINTQAYGIDTGENFIDLIRAILEQTNIKRVSFGSINPWSINKEFITFYKKQITDNKQQLTDNLHEHSGKKQKTENKKQKANNSDNHFKPATCNLKPATCNRLVHYFHIPLQSGSDKILKLMNRGYTRTEFLKKINAIQKINPMALIATDVIVGFLDESEKDFADTYNFLKNSPISKFHVFRYSSREGTAAYFMSKKLKEPPEEVKKKRAQVLIELGRKKYARFLGKHIGKIFPALFLDKKNNGLQVGLLDNQIPIMVKTSRNLKGTIKFVKAEKVQKYQLLGKLI